VLTREEDLEIRHSGSGAMVLAIARHLGYRVKAYARGARPRGARETSCGGEGLEWPNSG
jgi:hypothetical protein